MVLSGAERQAKYRKRHPHKKKERRDKSRKLIKDYLFNNFCKCGEENPNKLCFHHICSDKKILKISRLVSYSQTKLLEEIDKCIVLCYNCHDLFHNGTNKSQTKRLINSYNNIQKNKRSSKKVKILLWLYKSTCFCLKCNYKKSAGSLLFHHIESANKKKAISQLKSISSINQELSKTICLCRNCHEDFHYIYGKKTTKKQLEEYTGKPIIPLKVDIKDYLPLIDYQISNFYNLSFSL